jgi:catechol 2,3-dioxygenase-like lactoylglutathione lyase family enzyme
MLTTLPRILSFGFTCADAEVLARFYSERLGLEREATLELGGPYAELIGLPGSRLKQVVLHAGSERLELTQVLALGPGLRPGRPVPLDARSNDQAFQHICLVTADLQQAAAPLQADLAAGRLRPISSGPQTLPADNPAAAGIVAFKLRDPEGHALELLQFPADKGEARWHRAPGDDAGCGGAIVGIDHSAIGVVDSARSRRFYEGLLGLRLAGDGINLGREQDHLDGLDGTRVRITAHRCPTGPGVECLHYQAPAGGLLMPADRSAADLEHWQIRLAVADLAAIAAGLAEAGGSASRPDPLSLEPQSAQVLGFRQALQVRDPDGHILQLVSD